MKKAILILTICLIPFSMFSQIDLGAKAGINLTNISAELLTDDYHISSDPKSKVGYHAGAFFRVSLFGLFIQPELLYTTLSSDFLVTDQVSQAEQVANQKISRIDMPLLIGARLGTLRLGVGPIASIVVSDKSDLTEITGYEAKLNAATFGYQLGAGFDIKKFGFDIRYEGNLSKLSDQINIGGQTVNFDSRAKQLIFSLSYRFL